MKKFNYRRVQEIVIVAKLLLVLVKLVQAILELLNMAFNYLKYSGYRDDTLFT